jgi:radical SAM protein with 4Fe4S-binding SPASM domain
VAAPGSEEWVPGRVADLHITERDGNWLCLNPSVPGWMVTTRAGVLLARLVDGQRSVRAIGEFLRANGIAVDQRFVDEFFEAAKSARVFDPPPPPYDLARHWQDRRLTAMHLHLTDRCNLECTYCLRESSPRVKIQHRPDRFIELFDYLAPFAADRLEVTFTGGEPLMYPGFAKVVEASSGHGFHNLLFTNGILVTDARAEFIASHFMRVQVSLDGADVEAHAETRGNNAQQVLRGIYRLSAAGAAITVQVTISTHNLDSARRIRDVLPEDVNLRFTPVMPHGRGAQVSDLFLSDDQFLAFRRDASDERPLEQYRPGVQSRSCHAGLSNLSIADTGDVYPCHLFHQPAFWFGNVFHDRFEDIFFGDAIRRYVTSMDVDSNNSVCAECEVRYLCGGGCKANAMASTGDYHGVDMWCNYLKETIFDSLLGVQRSTRAPLALTGTPAASSGTPVELTRKPRDDRRTYVVGPTT